jgi:hypothetical protein
LLLFIGGAVSRAGLPGQWEEPERPNTAPPMTMNIYNVLLFVNTKNHTR